MENSEKLKDKRIEVGKIRRDYYEIKRELENKIESLCPCRLMVGTQELSRLENKVESLRRKLKNKKLELNDLENFCENYDSSKFDKSLSERYSKIWG